MEVGKIISHLIGIEVDISNYYGNMAKIEAENMDVINWNNYLVFHELEKKISEENTFINGFSASKKKEIYNLMIRDEEYLYGLLPVNDFSPFILERIKNKLITIGEDFRNYEYISIGNTPEAYKKNFWERISKLNKAQAIYERESLDLFLSFIDEEIKKEENLHNRQILVNFKYFNIYNSYYEAELSVIARKMMTEVHLLLSSGFESSIEHIDPEILETRREKMFLEGFDNLVEVLNYLPSDEEEDKPIYLTVFLCKMRSLFLLLNDDEFNKVYTFFCNNNWALLENVIDKFDIDIINMVKKDRERHKRLSIAMK